MSWRARQRRVGNRCLAATCLAVLIVTAPAFAAVARPAAAAQATDTIAIWGIGQISCGRFVQERERGAGAYGPFDATFRQWLLGFLTALNWSDPERPDLLAGTDAEGAMLWVENHCRSQPLDTFFDAALALRRELVGKAR